MGLLYSPWYFRVHQNVVRVRTWPGNQSDAEHPTAVTMSRVRLKSDTCDLYFSYIKVNLLLYTCPLDPFEDGILLNNSTRVHA